MTNFVHSSPCGLLKSLTLAVKIPNNLGKHEKGILLLLASLQKKNMCIHRDILSRYAPTFITCSFPFNKRVWRSSDVMFADISSSLVCYMFIDCMSTPSVSWPPQCWLVYYHMCTRTHIVMEKKSCQWNG